MKASFLFFFGIVVGGISHGQGFVTISGKVTNAETKKPLQFVNVYFNNTSFGSVTDSLGNYRINKVPLELKELIASSVGFKTARIVLQLEPGKNQVVNFSLVTDAEMLAVVVVKAKHDRTWLNNYEFFKSVFLGETPNASQTEILNPSVLNLTSNLDNLMASAREAIEIENHALGYRLFVSLKHFEASKSKTGISYSILMTTRFDTLTPKNGRERDRWDLNRIKTYNGSQQHFFKSLRNGRASEEGFRMFNGKPGLKEYSTNKALVPESAIEAIPEKKIKIAALNGNFEVLPQGVYQIEFVKKILPMKYRQVTVYPFPVSWLIVDKTPLVVDSNGEPQGGLDFWSYGYFDSFRLADLLPKDYSPTKEEEHFALAPLKELVSIQGVVTDNQKNPLPGGEVFINNGLAHTTTNAWGQFELANLSPGNYPIGFTFWGKQSVLKTVVVNADKDAFTMVQMQNKNHEHTGEYSSTEFQQLLFQGLLIPGLFESGRIVNPMVLRFNEMDKQTMAVDITAPLNIEKPNLGYQWKYFLENGVINRSKKTSLQISGLVKMDTMTSTRNLQRYHRMKNQFDEYSGSINNFIYSLVEGRTKEEGFKTYVFDGSSYKRKPKFTKVLGNELKEIDADSLLVVDNGRFYLKVPPGLEIHYDYKNGDKRFYRGYSRRVLRLQSDLRQVSVTRSGVADMEHLTITGAAKEILTRLPLDYQPPFKEIAADKEKLFVKNFNLQLIKTQLEKAYVQTDRPYYYPGDTIWLKAYMNYANLQNIDSLSRVLYVDLINSANKTLDTRIIKIDHGQAWGDMVLPYDLSKGDYAIRAYTKWMRNFNEVYSKPLPILAQNTFIKPQDADTVSFSPTHATAKLISDKAQYNPRDEIKVEVLIADRGVPSGAGFSVSVTDESAVTDIAGIPTIWSLSEPFEAEGDKLLRIKYPVERTITLSGRIQKDIPISSTLSVGKEVSPGRTTLKKFGFEGYSISTLFLRKNISTITKVKGEDFKLHFDFNDTVTAVIKAIDKDGKAVGIQLDEFDSLKNFSLPPKLKYKLDSADSSPVKKRPTLLKEVVIRSKRIPQFYPSRNKTVLQDLMGTPDYIYEGYALENLRKAGQSSALISFLSNKVPDFVQTAFIIGTMLPGGPQTLRSAISSAPSASAVHNYSLALNGSAISYSDFYYIQAPLISRIEVYNNRLNPNGNGQTRIVSIFTEPFMPHLEENYQYKIRGYDVPLTFRIPNANVPDYRATVYWNPNLKTDQQGKATILFRATDVAGTYKVTVEGVTEKGEYFRKVKTITVKN